MPTAARRERKIVTVLFCDLVGFTSQAESMDPEDVEALLRPYHSRVRAELQRHGGTVEKFIGDAVVALFGAPVAHEDDPERAVRAALAIQDFAVEDGLELRIGITTGEVLISLDARSEKGEGMVSGDVVNTAARLQSAAPVNSILVDETTARATRDAIVYADVEPVEAKGKSLPIPVRLAREARARFGVDVAHEARTELVGRERELSVVRDAFARARHERTPQLVTLVGIPGIGKSRLVYELSRIVDADPDIITWRQGRCLAYGDGITLWALGEIVKAQAGIVEQDTSDDVTAKIQDSVEAALAGSGDEAWVESHLLALVGLAGETELGGDRRGEAFAAWRRFLEALAEQRPVILVFEDLHWADETLLDFVDELVDWLSDVPLLVVGTARPELLERRPNWGGGKLNATTLALTPLSDEQTARLLSNLLDTPLLEAETQQALLERAGGNPLYAEQFSDLFRERGSIEELPLPETLQGIIAARLDGLQRAEKELLRDASIVGKVFWQSSLGEGKNGAGTALHSLERKGFVRRQRRSSLEGESEFAFAHALVRDVAYGQIARVERAAKHRRVAEWIEALGRPEDHAEMVAYHYDAALELARATGGESEELVEKTRLALRAAGDRAVGLNAFSEAERRYEQALALWPEDAADYPELLFYRAQALYLAGDERRDDALGEARDALLANGDVERAAETEAFLGRAAWYKGDRDSAEDHLERAEELVSDTGASHARARVLAFVARMRMLAGEYEAAIRIAREALALAEQLELHELRAHALTTIGTAMGSMDPFTGREELEEALELARAVNAPTVATTLNNLAVINMFAGDLSRGAELYDAGLAAAERLGVRDDIRFLRAQVITSRYWLGDWDEAAADAFIADCESSPHYQEGSVREVRAAMRLARGDREGASEDSGRSLVRAREIKDPQALLPTLAAAARLEALLGRPEQARAFADEALEMARENTGHADYLGLLGPYAVALGFGQELRELVELAPAGPWREVAVAGASGDLTGAADRYMRIGAPTMEADARLAAADRLLAQGRRSEAGAQLEKALVFYRSVGATFFIERAERLLGAPAQSESA